MTNLLDQKDNFIIFSKKYQNDIENIKSIMQETLILVKPSNFILLINFYLPITIYSLKRHLRKRR